MESSFNFATMKLFFVLTVLLSFLGNGFSDEIAPVVSTLYSGPVSPVGIWSDAKGNIYGCETGFHSVFKITSGGVKTDFAGTRGTAGVASEGVLAVSALFNSPRAVWGDGQFLYVTDSVNNRIRRVSWTTSLVTTVVGGGSGSILTSGSFPGTSVALTLPNAIAGSSNGKIYFADFGHVYVLNTETGLVGVVSFIAGGGDRIGTFAHGAQLSLKDIQGLAVDPTNNFLFVADTADKVVRKMDLVTGHSIIFAGRVKKEHFRLPHEEFENGESAYKVKFGNPSSVWVGDDGSVFIADSLYHTISVVRHDKIYLFAGKWSSGAISNTLMTGPANQVQIEAGHIFGDASKGVLYLCDGTRGGIQQISPLTVNVYAPTATPTVRPTKNPTSQPSGQPTSHPTLAPPPLISKTTLGSFLSEPAGVWVDAVGNVFVASHVGPSRHQIWKQAADGSVTPFAGVNGLYGFSGDGGAATSAALEKPQGLWGDSENLYICDTNNDRVRAVNFATYEITTIIGGGNNSVIGTSAQLATNVTFKPYSVWGDGKDSLYILTTSEVLLYSFVEKTIRLLAYSNLGDSLTGEHGEIVDFLDLARANSLLHISGDVSRNCLYISEKDDFLNGPAYIVRKLDFKSQTATIFAGRYAQSSTVQYTDGVLATEIQGFSSQGPTGLWVASDGTVFVADYGTTSISAINPNTNEIRWFAGTWNDHTYNGVPADSDANNYLHMGGLPKLGKIQPTYLTGNSELNTLYMVDKSHIAVRKISPLFKSPVVPAGRKLEQEILSSKTMSHLRGSA
jgi:hypothetical protein